MLVIRWEVSLLLGLCLCLVAPSGADTRKKENDRLESYSPRARAVVSKMAKSLKRLRSYEDQATFKIETDAKGFPGGEQDVSFVYARPNRFRMKTQMGEIVCDGKEITVYLSHIRRYKVMPVGKVLPKQIEAYTRWTGLRFSNGHLILPDTPEQEFARHFHDLDVTGRETLDGDACLVLEGMADVPGGWLEQDVPVTIWMRERDGIVRRIELELTDTMKEQFKDRAGGTEFTEYRFVYDVGELRINEKIEPDRFTFSEPRGAKKVNAFYGLGLHTADGAARFELSGKQAPGFELDTLDGQSLSRDDFEGKVVVLAFTFAWQDRPPRSLERLQGLHEKYRNKGVAVFAVVQASSRTDELVKQLEEAGISFPVAIDADRSIGSDYYFSRNRGVVLIDKKGVVQGRYTGGINSETAESVAKDIDELLAGRQLPGGKPMTPEEIEEAEDQRAARDRPAHQDEPVNENRLEKRWSVPASGGGIHFSFGGAPAPAAKEGFWVRHKNTLRQVNHRGEVAAEVSLGDLKEDPHAPPTFAAGRLGPEGRLGVIFMTPILSEDEQREGHRLHVGATFTAIDEEGQQLWTYEVKGQRHQLPDSVALADLDGRPGDELIFVYNAAIHIVDGEGELLVRKPCDGWPRWMRVEDRDRDGKAEVYLRTQDKLYRYDYKPPR